MRMLRILVAFALMVAGVVSTVGSGGGGGGDDVDWSPILNLVPGPPPTSMDITTANAQDVSSTVVQAIDRVFDVAAKMGGQIFPVHRRRRICYQGTASSRSLSQSWHLGNPSLTHAS